MGGKKRIRSFSYFPIYRGRARFFLHGEQMSARRYSEPDANAPEYSDCRRKRCTICGRSLPNHPDFFSVHTVIAPHKREVYRYRRPECRTCRAASMRAKHAEQKEIDAYIENEGA